MIARRPMVLVALLVAGGALLGCTHHSKVDDAPRAARADSLAGVVSVTGTAFEEQLVVRAAGGRVVPLMATTWDSAALVRMGGAEVVVRGQDDGKRFLVESFRVRAVNGVAVADGTLAREGSRISLLTDAGPQSLGNPPAALRHLIGARVWIGGSLSSGPNEYGVILPAP